MYTAAEKFMANQIVAGKVTYVAAVTARPDLKAGIDAYLTEIKRTDLIVEPIEEG